MRTSTLCNRIYVKLCELTYCTNVNFPHLVSVICLLVLSVQSLDPEARGWTSWEKLESNIKEIWISTKIIDILSPKLKYLFPGFILKYFTFFTAQRRYQYLEFFKYEIALSGYGIQ